MNVVIRHATRSKNLLPILDDGILCEKAKGKRKVVWLHSPSKSSWAVSIAVRK
jgi:hypothetical protein